MFRRIKPPPTTKESEVGKNRLINTLFMHVAITPSPTSALHNPDLDDRQVRCHVLKDAHVPNVTPASTGQTGAAELFPCSSCQNLLGCLYRKRAGILEMGG